MKKLFLITGFVLFFISYSLSQPVTLSGKVLDAGNGKPLVDVQVLNLTTGKGTVSNISGKFELTVSVNEKVQLQFSKLSYETLVREISMNEPVKEIIVSLLPKSEQLEEVEIFGITSGDHNYRTEYVDINKLQQTNKQDIGDLLRGVPNLSGVRKGAMGIDPVIRGFKYSQLNVQLNGGTKIEGGCPNRMDPATAHVDISDVSNIIVLKGPFALKYGVNFGGIIDMTTYQPVFYQQYKTRIEAIMGAQTNHEGAKAKVGVSGANRLLTYNISGSWKKYSNYQDGNDNWIPASLQQQTLSASLGFKIALKHIIYASTDFSQGKNIDFPTLPMDERSDNTAIYSLNYFSELSGNSINFVRAKVYYSDVNHEMDNKNRPFSDTVVAVSTIHAVNAGAKFGINFNVGKGKLETGADYENIYKDGTRLKTMIMQPMLPEKEEELWNNAHINNLGVYAEYVLTGTRLDWVFAARIDLNEATSGPMIWNNMAGDAVFRNDSTESSYMNFSFSAGFDWKLNKYNNLVFSFGRGARSPDMTERYIILLPTGYDPYDYLGNPQLKPEVNHEFDLGYKLTKTAVGKVDLSGFFSYITNYISTEYVPPSEIKPQTKGVLGVKRFVNISQAYMLGGEFTYQTPDKFLWELNLTMAYTMGWNPSATQQLVENGQVVGTENISIDPLPEIPPFETNISFNYKLFNRKLVPSVSMRWAAAQNRVSKAYGENASPAFTLFNIDLSYQFNQNLKIFGGIKNLFNTAYYEHLNRNIVGTQYPLYEPGIVFYANLIFNL